MVDKHIAKMILESVQMLSSTKRVLDPDSHMGPVYNGAQESSCHEMGSRILFELLMVAGFGR